MTGEDLARADDGGATPDDLIDRIFNARVTTWCIAGAVVLAVAGGVWGWFK